MMQQMEHMSQMSGAEFEIAFMTTVQRELWRKPSETKGVRMSIRTASPAAVVCIAILLQAPASGGQTPQKPPHQQDAATPSTDMSAKCKAMMAEHDKMMADMKTADQRLDGLVATMTSASGQAKVDATAAVVTEMVTQRKTMRERMMKMHEGRMGHMMEHMQAGPQSMGMCPMMKMGGMKH
jgi:hypothetical protein